MHLNINYNFIIYFIADILYSDFVIIVFIYHNFEWEKSSLNSAV